MNLLYPIFGFFFGLSIGILQNTPAKKRNKYAWKVLAFYLGFFGGFAMLAFLDDLINHLKRRQRFERWKDEQSKKSAQTVI